MTAILPQLAIRVDASTVIGTGHLFRCIAIAREARRQGIESVFVCRKHDQTAGRVLEKQSFSSVFLDAPEKPALSDCYQSWAGATEGQDAQESQKAITSLPIRWWIVDHYGLSQEWEGSIESAGMEVTAIDDLFNRRHDCTRLVDHNIGTSRQEKCDLSSARTKVMAGPRYALVRSEFGELRGTSPRSFDIPARNVLLSLGGSDPNGVSLAIVQELAKRPQTLALDWTIVCGSANRNAEAIHEAVKRVPAVRQCVNHVDEMWTSLGSHDIAVGAGGVSALERCVLGVPTVLLALVPNQTRICLEMEKAKAAVLADPSEPAAVLDAVFNLAASPESLTELSKSAYDVCDGNGINRVLQQMFVRQE